MAKKKKNVYLPGERRRIGYVKEVQTDLGTMYAAHDYRDIHLGTFDTPEDASDTVTDWFVE